MIAYHLLREETDYDAGPPEASDRVSRASGGRTESSQVLPPAPHPLFPLCSGGEGTMRQFDGDESETEGNRDQRSSENFVAL